MSDEHADATDGTVADGGIESTKDLPFKARQKLRKVDDHDNVLDKHDTRITRNERWRLRVQGALQFAAVILGSAAITWLIQVLA